VLPCWWATSRRRVARGAFARSALLLNVAVMGTCSCHYLPVLVCSLFLFYTDTYDDPVLGHSLYYIPCSRGVYCSRSAVRSLSVPLPRELQSVLFLQRFGVLYRYLPVPACCASVPFCVRVSTDSLLRVTNFIVTSHSTYTSAVALQVLAVAIPLFSS
jgi:hypothetical protein